MCNSRIAAFLAHSSLEAITDETGRFIPLELDISIVGPTQLSSAKAMGALLWFLCMI